MAISIGKLVFVCIFLILCVEMPTSLANEYVVGDKRGWSPGVDYHPWAYGKSFRVGDVLRKYCFNLHDILSFFTSLKKKKNEYLFFLLLRCTWHVR